jgi:hypothetical protein
MAAGVGMAGEPTVAQTVGLKTVEQIRVGRTELHVVVRLGHGECEMSPVAARYVARLLVDLANEVENQSTGERKPAVMNPGQD